MISSNSNVEGLDKESQAQIKVLKLEADIKDLQRQINEQADVFDERLELQKRDLKDFIRVNIIAVKEDSKPKQSFWNFINPFK